MQFEAAVRLRLEHAHRPDVPEDLRGLVVEPAERLVDGSERADLVGSCLDCFEYGIGHGGSHFPEECWAVPERFFAARATAISMSWSSWPPTSLRRPASMRISAPETR